MKQFITVVIGALLISSCSYFTKKGAQGEGNVAIRYVNLKALYEFTLNRNRDAVALKQKVDDQIEILKGIEERLSKPGEKHDELIEQYNKTRKKLERLKKRSTAYKEKILSLINRAVKNVAGHMKVDYVMNIGDDLIYAKKDYDITDEVIQEILRLKERSTPVSR